MDRRSVVTALLGLAAGPTFAQADDPTAPVRAGYAHQAAKARAKNPVPVWAAPVRSRLFSRRLTGLLDAEERSVRETGEMGAIGYDPFLNGQDGSVSNLALKVTSRSGDEAVVQASFRSLNHPRIVTFPVVKEGGEWRIADIVGSFDGEPQSLLKILEESYPDQK